MDYNPNAQIFESQIVIENTQPVGSTTGSIVNKGSLSTQDTFITGHTRSMSQGTFEALCANPVCYLQNNESFDRVRASITGNVLTIMCENISSTDKIDWMVVAERKDPFIKNWDPTDANGFLVPEYNKPE